jgi:hypothetical protein
MKRPNSHHLTRGPWRRDQNQPFNVYYEGWLIATAHHSKYDANLIAAAPDLFEALEALAHEWVNGRNVLDGCDKEVADKVRAALHKAQWMLS